MNDHHPSSGHDPALPETWDGAFNATDTILIGIEGLIHAAYILADEHPALGGPQRETAALHVVLDTLREKNAALRDARSAEFRAGLALRKSSEANMAGSAA